MGRYHNTIVGYSLIISWIGMKLYPLFIGGRPACRVRGQNPLLCRGEGGNMDDGHITCNFILVCRLIAAGISPLDLAKAALGKTFFLFPKNSTCVVLL